MLTGEEKTLLEHWAGTRKRREELATSLCHPSKHKRVGFGSLDRMMPGVFTKGIGSILEDVSDEAELRMYAANPSSPVLNPDIIVVREFWNSQYGGFRALKRNPVKVRADVLDTLRQYLPDNREPVAVIADPMADGRVYVPTTRDYAGWVSSGTIRRASDLAMAVSLNGRVTKFSKSQLDRNPGLASARHFGEEWARCEIVACTPVEHVIESLNELEKAWYDYHRPSRRSYDLVDKDDIAAQLRNSARDPIAQFLDEITHLSIATREALDGDRDRVAVVFADSWMFDSPKYVSTMLREEYTVVQYVPILYESSKND